MHVDRTCRFALQGSVLWKAAFYSHWRHKGSKTTHTASKHNAEDISAASHPKAETIGAFGTLLGVAGKYSAVLESRKSQPQDELL
ncbi:MAG TPA: hypothetical protein VJR93_00060 [Chthoniobacterales bacterium]|nr:hypothetical protein [Chthoniobacterales bacterium]